MANKDRYRLEYRYIIDCLIEERKRIGLNQWDVALKMGTDQSQISKLERGERRLDVIDYLRYCRALDLDPGSILKKVPIPLE